MLIRSPFTSQKDTYAHVKYYFVLLVLLYEKIQTFHEQKRLDGWAANIFSSNTRHLEHQAETTGEGRKTVDTRCTREDERSAFPGWMVKEEVRGGKTYERWYVQRWNIYTRVGPIFDTAPPCRPTRGRHGWFIQAENRTRVTIAHSASQFSLIIRENPREW